MGWVEVGVGLRLGWGTAGVGVVVGLWLSSGWFGVGSGSKNKFKIHFQDSRPVGLTVFTKYNTLYGLPLGNPFSSSVAILNLNISKSTTHR